MVISGVATGICGDGGAPVSVTVDPVVIGGGGAGAMVVVGSSDINVASRCSLAAESAKRQGCACGDGRKPGSSVGCLLVRGHC